MTSLAVLAHLRDSDPQGLIALAGNGQLETYLTSTAASIDKVAEELVGVPHPVFNRKFDRREAKREALMQVLPADEHEATDKDRETADRIAEAFEAKLIKVGS